MIYGSHRVLDGEGLPILIPMDKDPRQDRFLLGQLVGTGSRTVQGMAAVNGEMLRRLKLSPDPEKGELIPFEEAYQNFTDARNALRANPNLPLHYEKEKGKLGDEFSAFVGRTPPPTPKNKGNPHSDDSKPQDDGVDFGVPEEDEEPEVANKAPVEEEPPTYEDMDNGPLAGHGVDTVAKHMGAPRFRWGSHWEARRISACLLDTKDGHYFSYPLDGGHFTTVTRRVAAATESGAAKAIISYASDSYVPGSG